MSKGEMPSIDRSKCMAEQSMSSYQSVWMAHWKVAKLSPPSKQELLPMNHMAREIASDSTSGLVVTSSLSDGPKMDNKFCEVPAKNTVNIVDVVTNIVDVMDGKTVTIGSQYLTEEGPISTPSLSLAPPQPGDANFPIRNQRGSTFSYHETRNPLATQIFPKNRIEGSTDVSKQPFESDNFVGKKGIVFSSHYLESPLGSTSRQVPHSLDTEGNSLTFSADKFDHHTSMATPSLWNRAASLLQSGYTPTGQKEPLTYAAKNNHKVYHQVLPSEKSPLEMIKRKTSCYEHSSQPSHDVVDVMTTRTHTFVDSTKRLAAGQMKFSQTMHHLFLSEKTDTHKSKRGQIFRESTVYANYQGNSSFGQFLSLSTDGGYHGNPGVKLQPLWSSTDSEGHENLANVKASDVFAKNESSAETNTLDMDVLAGKHLSGEASSLPKKDASAEEVIGSLTKIGSSEMKRKFLTLVTMPSSADDGEPSPSKTQSLEVDHLLPHDDQGTCSNPKAQAHCNNHHEPEQRNGRMKQLKAIDSDQLQESLKSGHVCPVRKANDISGRISEQTKGILQPDMECATSTKGCVSTSGDKAMGGEGRGTLLSDPWIRRWCHHKTADVLRKKQEPVSTKGFDELQNKPLPSVAAMALMGKAMNGFHPCEFTRRGSLVVWKS